MTGGCHLRFSCVKRGERLGRRRAESERAEARIAISHPPRSCSFFHEHTHTLLISTSPLSARRDWITPRSTRAGIHPLSRARRERPSSRRPLSSPRLRTLSNRAPRSGPTSFDTLSDNIQHHRSSVHSVFSAAEKILEREREGERGQRHHRSPPPFALLRGLAVMITPSLTRQP